MAYMRGDYTRGDYYTRGDPGFFGNLFRGIGHIVGSTALGLVTGGPIGGIIGAVKGTVSGTRANIADTTLAAGGTGSAYTPQLRIAHANALARHQAGGPMIGIMAPGGGAPGMAMVPGAPTGMRRMHPNRSTYVTRGGGTSRWPVGLTAHEKGTELVPSRRMNVANPRALRRALRRVGGFAKIVKRTRRAVSRAASAVGIHRRVTKRRVGK
jgi:hypothetical protein